jgi:hypothetical protein
MCRLSRIRLALNVVALLLLAAAPVRAQALLPSQGEGAVSFMFQDELFVYHALPTTQVDVGHIRSESMFVDVTYGVTSNLAVTLGVPWVVSKYTGSSPHPVSVTDPTPTPLDDGQYHGALQDVRFDVRYNVTKRVAVLTPFMAINMPSHDYTYFAHAAPGRRLKELQVGVSGAHMLDSVPGLFVQARYAYGFVEKIEDVAHNRSVGDLEVGYFLTPKLRLLGLSTGQITHGGVDFVQGQARAQLGPLFAYHDQIDRVNMLALGGGASYAITDTIDVYGSLMHTVEQRNGHVLDRGITIGVSVGFATRLSAERALAERRLIKCLCEKGTK